MRSRHFALRAFARLEARDREIIGFVVGDGLTFARAGERLGLGPIGARIRYAAPWRILSNF